MATLWPLMSMGKVGYAGLSNEEIEAVKRTFHKYNDVEGLLNIADTFRTVPTASMEAILSNAIQHAGRDVSETFFNKPYENLTLGGKDFSSACSDLAVCLMFLSFEEISKYGFNTVTNTINAKNTLDGIIEGSVGKELGNGLLVETLVQHHGFQEYLNAKESWVSKLESILQDEVYIIGTIVKQLTEEVDLPVKMKLFMLKELGSSKVEAIANRWASFSNIGMMQPAIDFVKKDNHLINVSVWLHSRPFLNEVQSACYKSSTITYPNPNYNYMCPFVTETTHGSAVMIWIYAADMHSLFSGHDLKNVVTDEISSALNCFVAGTLVSLDNNKSVTIEHLKEHDKILGSHGNVGIISSEKVVNALEEETPIFGFNDDEPFFLASHPFWSQDGWRAVDPFTAKKENSWLEVGQLTEGDFIRKIRCIKDMKIEYEWVEISTIHRRVYPTGTKVYGVHTREGPRSYHANGYLVLENYPEITAQSAAEGMKNLSFEEQHEFQDRVNELEPLLNKVLGESAAKAVTSLSQRYLKDKRENPSKNEATKIPLKEVSLPDLKLHYQAGNTKTGSYKMPCKVSLMRGHLFVDGQHVSNATISANDNVSWSRTVPDGKWEHGSIKLHHGRLQGHGFVALTQNFHDTVSLASANFAVAAHYSEYTSYQSNEVLKKGSTPTAKTTWKDIGKLKIGVDCSKGVCKTVGLIDIEPGMEGDYDSLNNHVIFTVNPKTQHLTVTVSVPASYQLLLGYIALVADFSPDFASFSGYCTAYDKTKAGFVGHTYAWKGTVKTSLPAMEMLSVARNESLKSSLHAQANSIPSTQAFDAIDGPRVAPMANTVTTLTAQNLNINELFMLTPPDSQTVHDNTFSMMQEVMKYEMNTSDLEDILGVTRPTDLSGDLTAVGDKYKDFFGTRFANAYIMNGLKSSVHFKGKITQEEKDQLLYFWAGQSKGTTCLANDADYNKANNEVARVAYLKTLPDLAKYVNSAEGGPHWATQLYNRLNRPEVLNGLALSALISETMTIIQKQTMVLYCLDPSSNDGAKFFKKIMTTRLNETSSYFNGNKQNDKIMTEVFSDFIHQLIVQILTGGDSITKAITKELNEQLKAAAKELNVAITDDAEETASAMMAHMQSIIADIITFFNNKSGRLWDKLTAGVNKWMENHKILKYLGKFISSTMSLAMWGASIYFTIKAYLKWNDLTPEKKVSCVMNTVHMVLKAISKFPDMLKSFQAACSKGKAGFEFIKSWLQTSEDEIVLVGFKDVIDDGIKVVNGADANVDEVIAEAASESAADLPETITTWQKFFAITKFFAKFTGFLASAAGCVVIGLQIYRDFADGAPVAQKALDICQGITIGVATIAAAIGIFVECAVLPIIGIVCAVVGLIFAIASLFVHRDPPKPKPTKVDLFVDNVGNPYVEKLTKPTAEWLKKYHKDHPDKKKTQ